MQFTPKTEEELNATLEPGEYDAEVLCAEDKQSKSGNDMIELRLKIYAPGQEYVVTDYLLPKVAYKIRHFCTAIGKLPVYNTGRLSAGDCAGYRVTVITGIEKDKTGQYPDKVRIKDYAAPRAISARSAATSAPAVDDSGDDIPF